MEELLAPKKHSVWDDYVPIITEGRHTDIYLTDGIEAPSEYTKACRLITQAYPEDTITLHINSGGGYVDSGFMIIDALEHTSAKVTARLTGTVASIATIIALRCDDLVVSDHIAWLSHNYSGGVQGKGGEMKAQMEFMAAELATSFRALHEGFFTADEIDNIINDKDMWLNKAEIVARWNAFKSCDSEALDKIAVDRKTK